MPYKIRQLLFACPSLLQAIGWTLEKSIHVFRKEKNLVRILSFTVSISFYLLVLCPFNALGQDFGVPLNRKVIDMDGFKEIVYITKKQPYPKNGKMYHWYKTREVHTSQSNYAGELLDGDYLKYYPDNQLAEKGTFKKGLKVSVWNTWYPNGRIHTRSLWKKGRLSGKYIKWDSIGNTLETGRYRRGFKNGKWVFSVKGDTIQYKKGRVVVKNTVNDSLQQRPSFFKRIFHKNEKKDDKPTKAKNAEKKDFFKKLFGKKEDREKVKGNKKKKRNKRPKANKEGFLKRIFKKKDKKVREKDA